MLLLAADVLCSMYVSGCCVVKQAGRIAEAVWLELWELGRPWTVGLLDSGRLGKEEKVGGCMWLVAVWPVALDSFRAIFKFLID